MVKISRLVSTAFCLLSGAKISCPGPSQRHEVCCSLCCMAWSLLWKIGLDEDLFSITEQPRLGSVGLISMRNKAMWVSGPSFGARVPLFCIYSCVWLISIGMGKGLGLSGLPIPPDTCSCIWEDGEWARTVGSRNKEERRKAILP